MCKVVCKQNIKFSLSHGMLNIKFTFFDSKRKDENLPVTDGVVKQTIQGI